MAARTFNFLLKRAGRREEIFNRNVMLGILTTFPASFIYPPIIYYHSISVAEGDYCFKVALSTMSFTPIINGSGTLALAAAISTLICSLT
jgi:hypothetical protein